MPTAPITPRLRVACHRYSAAYHYLPATATYEALDKYARDLTAEARAGRLDPVIGRDDEVRRAMTVLYLPTSPYISPYLPLSPRISPARCAAR